MTIPPKNHTKRMGAWRAAGFAAAFTLAALPALARFWALKQTDKFRSTRYSSN